MKHSPAHRVVVLGTGTEIGKTHVVECLLACRPPPAALALKPVESGYSHSDPRSDQRRLQADGPAPYLLEEGISPHLAARRAGVTIEAGVIDAWVAQPREATWLLIETAGGALSPLTDQLDNTGLARHLDPVCVLLVAPDRLGVLHDVRATCTAIRALAPGLPLPLIALSAPAKADASTGRNGEELLRLLPSLACVSFPRARPADAASGASAERLWARLDEAIATSSRR